MKLFAITVFFMSCNIAFAMSFRRMSMFVLAFIEVIYFIRLHLTLLDQIWPWLLPWEYLIILTSNHNSGKRRQFNDHPKHGLTITLPLNFGRPGRATGSNLNHTIEAVKKTIIFIKRTETFLLWQWWYIGSIYFTIGVN